MRRINIISLGCPRNTVDSELLLARLKRKGFKFVPAEKADAIIINTCSFIQDAKMESIEAVMAALELKKKNKKLKIIICGCMVKHYGRKLIKYFKGVDAFVDVLQFEDKPGYAAGNFTPKHIAYLKISEGCLHNCSYCVIPKIKGRLKSKSLENILKEVRQLDQAGVKELNIIAQDTTSWGKDLPGNVRLSFLLEKIESKAKNIKWIRLLYAYPDDIDSGLIEVIAGSSKICHYLDIPLQHINNRILKLMNRSSSRKKIEKLISKIKKGIPDIALRTTFIVGFPTETEEEFEELLEFVRRQRFTHLGAFIYSREHGTPAAELKPLHYKTQRARFKKLMQTQQEISLSNNKQFLGKEMQVLIDYSRDNYSFARAYKDCYDIDGSVIIKGKFPAGEFIRAKIVQAYEYDLAGQKV